MHSAIARIARAPKSGLLGRRSGLVVAATVAAAAASAQSLSDTIGQAEFDVETGLTFDDALASAAASGPVPAEPGSLVYFDLSTGLRFDDNYENLVNPSGETSLWRTDFALGYESETSNQSFSAEAGARFELGHFAEQPDKSSELTNPFLALEYSREGAGALLETDLSYRETDNGINVYEDLVDSTDLIIDQGTRSDLRFHVGLVAGEDTPTSFIGSVDYHQRRFFDTTDVDLTNEDWFDASLELGLGVTRTTSVLVLADYFDRNDLENDASDETTASVGLGIETDVNPTLNFYGAVMYSQNERVEWVDGDYVTKTRSEPTLDFRLTQDRPAGPIFISYGNRLNSTGLLTTLRVGRELELRRSDMEFSIGATRTPEGDITGVGNLSWLREYRNSVLSVDYISAVYTNNDDENVLNSRLAADFRQGLTRVSSIGMSLNVSSSQGLGSDGTLLTQGVAAVNYYHDLNRQWELVTGYSYSYSDDDGEIINRNQIYATIDRRFSWRP